MQKNLQATLHILFFPYKYNYIKIPQKKKVLFKELFSTSLIQLKLDVEAL
jgi:hypothetical protein